MTFNWIQPGHPEVPPHDHPYDQLSFVFSGTLEIELAGKPGGDPGRHSVRAAEFVAARIEEQLVVTATGCEVITRFAAEDS